MTRKREKNARTKKKEEKYKVTYINMDRYINVIDMKRKKEKNRKGRRSIKLDKRK